MGLRRFVTNWVNHPQYCKKALSNIQYQLDKIDFSNIIGKTQYQLFLQDKALNFSGTGISNEYYCDNEIIVSLTSFGYRIHKAYLPIESIMQGSVKPNRIILWLSEKEFRNKTLPQTLQNQQSRGLEICYCDELMSYKKLIPTIRQYPKAIVVTIDDDVMYEYDMLERIINRHEEIPNAICACRMHRIVLDPNGMPLSYLKWNGCANDDTPSILNFPTGVGGVLYPPGSLNEEVFNCNVFLDICPKADDIWFYSMALLNGTPIVKVKTDNPDGAYYSLPLSPDSLCISNTDPHNCGNDVQLKKVFDRYGLYEIIKRGI